MRSIIKINSAVVTVAFCDARFCNDSQNGNGKSPALCGYVTEHKARPAAALQQSGAISLLIEGFSSI